MHARLLAPAQLLTSAAPDCADSGYAGVGVGRLVGRLGGNRTSFYRNDTDAKLTAAFFVFYRRYQKRSQKALTK